MSVDCWDTKRMCRGETSCSGALSHHTAPTPWHLHHILLHLFNYHITDPKSKLTEFSHTLHSFTISFLSICVSFQQLMEPQIRLVFSAEVFSTAVGLFMMSPCDTVWDPVLKTHASVSHFTTLYCLLSIKSHHYPLRLSSDLTTTKELIFDVRIIKKKTFSINLEKKIPFRCLELVR